MADAEKSDQGVVQKDPTNEQIRRKIYETGGLVLKALAAKARTEELKWSNDTLVAIDKRLRSAKEELDGEPLFEAHEPDKNGEPKKFNPRFKAGWIGFLQFHKNYFQATYRPDNVVQAWHALKIRRVLEALSILPIRPDIKADVYKPESDRLLFLEEALQAIKDFEPALGDEGAKRKTVKPTGDTQRSTAEVDRELPLKDPRIAGAREKKGAGFAHSLWAYLEWDDFQPRKNDLAFLKDFLGGTDPFAWTLVTGDGGEGKTRLALQLFDSIEPEGWAFGVLDGAGLKSAKGWRPARRTLIVIDDASRLPKSIGEFFREIVAVDHQHPITTKVRVLLLDRGHSLEWLDEVTPPEWEAMSVARYRYPKVKPAAVYKIEPLEKSALLAIAKGRLRSFAIDDSVLWNAICRVDPRIMVEDGVGVIRPRAVFAAMTGQVLAELAEHERGASTIAHKLEQSAVFDHWIQRERDYFWRDSSSSDSILEESRLQQHENLMLLATVCGGLRPRTLGKLTSEVRALLPAFIDYDLYHCMSGDDARDQLKGMKPDMLGEYFVLSTLLYRRSRYQQELLMEGALICAGSGFSLFLAKCAIDFRAMVRQIAYLSPGTSCTQISTHLYRTAVIDLIKVAAMTPPVFNGHAARNSRANADVHDLAESKSVISKMRLGGNHYLTDDVLRIWLRSDADVAVLDDNSTTGATAAMLLSSVKSLLDCGKSDEARCVCEDDLMDLTLTKSDLVNLSYVVEAKLEIAVDAFARDSMLLWPLITRAHTSRVS